MVLLFIRPCKYLMLCKILLVGGKGRRVVIMIELDHWPEKGGLNKWSTIESDSTSCQSNVLPA